MTLGEFAPSSECFAMELAGKALAEGLLNEPLVLAVPIRLP